MKRATFKRLLVCDLDNTLYDWVSYFVPAFYAMVDEAVELTGCDRERLLNDFRDVHRFHGDAEYPFSLIETRTVRALYPTLSRREVAKLLDSAFYAFNSSRKRNLQLYPGVHEALQSLQESGVALVAHTESSLYAVVDRLSRLDIGRYFDRIYCRERPKSEHPNPEVSDGWLEGFPMDKVIELTRHQRKPDPDVLLEICRKEMVTPAETAYVGDSIARDVLMAKSAGVFAIWAKYGTHHQLGTYEKLVRVSHWTDDDIAREQELKERARQIRPDFILEAGFQELLNVFGNPPRSVSAGMVRRSG